MKILKTICLSALLTLFGAQTFAIGINEAVEASRSQKSTTIRNRSSGSSSSSSDSCTDALCRFFCETCTEIAATVWGDLILSTRYHEYPYESDKTYQGYMYLDPDTPEHKSSGRFYRFSASASGFEDSQLGTGAHFDFEGMFFCIGPMVDYTSYFNNGPETNDGQMGNLKLGIQMPLILLDPFNCTLFVQWSHWNGDAHFLLKNNGVTFGANIGSYIGKPLHLNWKISSSAFGDNVNITESLLSAGVCMGRSEIFAGWKYMNIYGNNIMAPDFKYNSIQAGVRMYF